jgi:hypothetical protein
MKWKSNSDQILSKNKRFKKKNIRRNPIQAENM